MKVTSASICLISCLSLTAVLTADDLPTVDLRNPQNIVLQWDSAALSAIRVVKPAAPVAARALAILHTCMYDAWAPYDARALGTRFGKRIKLQKEQRQYREKQEAISYASYRCLSDLFPTQVAAFRAMMTKPEYDPDNLTSDIETAAGIGNVTAQAVLDFRRSDGSNQLGMIAGTIPFGLPYADYTGYQPVNTPTAINDPNRWQPLQVSDGHGSFVTQRFVTPQWQNVVPFALNTASEFHPTTGPARFGTDAYREEVDEVLKLSAELTDRQKMIAEYWADGPNSESPPGHWCLFAAYISRRDHHDLDQDVKMFFALGNALLDSSIACWDAKRTYDSVRPITAVRAQYAGKLVAAWAGPYQGTKNIPAESWLPYQPKTVITPAFAEYWSGHSTFSAAAAEILRLFTGSDRFGNMVTFPPHSSAIEPNTTPATEITLHWETFSEAADQAGLSRRYGGIHFRKGDIDARERGRLIGRQVWEKAVSYFDPQYDVQ